jgi:hypothetical protein
MSRAPRLGFAHSIHKKKKKERTFSLTLTKPTAMFVSSPAALVRAAPDAEKA